MKFNELNLSKPLLRAIEDVGYNEATYIQAACIPSILNNADVIGQSQTGTGKTAAFSIPLIEKLNNEPVKHPYAIILSPTRELALQVEAELKKFAKYKEEIRTTCIYGGSPIAKQISELKKGCHVVVGTPGRIIDHIHRKTLKLHECNTIILDEADEMLNMGFREDIEEILKNLKEEHQTILFSATMPQPILDITHLYQKHPLHIKTPIHEISATTIKQLYYVMNQSQKKMALMQLMQLYNAKLSMIFCNTKKMVDDLCQDLVSKGYPAAAIHGDMKQEMRLAVLNKFKERKITILIATDVAARGIDVNDMDVVFNYDFPQEDEYYIHRIGRTGRAGKDGLAITLVTPRQRHLIKNIEKKTKATVTYQQLPNKEEMKTLRFHHVKMELEHAVAKKIPNDIKDLVQQMIQDGYTYQELAEAFIYKLVDHDLFEEIKTEEKPQLKVSHKGYGKIELSIGQKDNLQPAFIVGAITEATGLSGKDIGKIKIKEHYSIVEVPKQYESLILNELKQTTIKGLQFKAKKATESSTEKKRRNKTKKDSDITSKDRKIAKEKAFGKKDVKKKHKTKK